MSRASWVRALFASVIGGCIGAAVDVGWRHVVVILAVAIAGYVVAWNLTDQ